MSTDTHTALSLLSSQTASATSGLGLKTAAARPALPYPRRREQEEAVPLWPPRGARRNRRKGKGNGSRLAQRGPIALLGTRACSWSFRRGCRRAGCRAHSRLSAPEPKHRGPAGAPRRATDGLRATSGVWDTHCCVRRLSNFVISSFPFAKILRPVISQQPA